MKAFVYYISHTFVNSFKKLFRTWVAAFLGIVFLFGLIGGIIGGAVGSYIDDSTADSGYSEEYIEEEPIEENIVIPPEDFENIVLPIIEIIAFFVPFIFVFIFFYTGDKSGAAIFTMADVNFLFASPLRPQSILCFKSFLQMGAIFLSSIYLMFQLPNLIFNLGLTVTASVIIVLAFIFCIILGMLTSVFTYTVVASKPSRKRFILPISVAVLLLVAGIFAAVKFFGDLSWFDALKATFASNYSRAFPVFGWMAALIVNAVKGNYLISALCFIGIVLFTALIFVLVWRIKADLYEDALIKATVTFEKQAAAAEGKQTRKRKRKEPAPHTEIGKGWGANAFFYKQMYVRRRNGFFGIFSKLSATYMLLAVLIAAFVKFVIGANTFIPVALTLLVVHFFRNFASPIDEEKSANFVLAVPESNRKKVFWLLAAGAAGAFIDALPAFIVSGLLLGDNIATTLFWFLVFITFDSFTATSGLATDGILPARLPKAIKAMFCIYIRMLLAVPGLILLIIGMVSGNMAVFALLTALLNLLAATGCFFVGSALLKE